MTSYNLTPEQEALADEYREKWEKIASATGPCDFERAKEAAILSYDLAEIPRPTYFFHAASPVAGAITAALLIHLFGRELPKKRVEGPRVLYPDLEEIVPKVVSGMVCETFDLDHFLEQVYRELGSVPADPSCAVRDVEKLARECVSDHAGGAHDGGWLSFYNFVQEVVKDPECDKLQGLMDMARVCGWWMPYDQVVILEDRPTEIHLEDGELSNEEGPAVAYSDGFALWSIAGVEVPRYVVENPSSITVDKIKAQSNAEIQLIMRQRFGEARYLQEIGAKIIDVDTVPCEYGNEKTNHIFRSLMEDDEGNRFLVGPDGSTKGRVFVMRVPPETQTCVEAEGALTGLDSSKQLGRS